MSRETLIVPEKKDKITKIKAKYKNMQMDDDVAKKIQRYEIVNKILKTAAVGAGIITAVDIIVPDPLLGIDEVALTAITSLLGGASTLVDKKIDELVKDGNTSLQMQEVTKLTDQITTAAKSIKNINQNKTK